MARFKYRNKKHKVTKTEKDNSFTEIALTKMAKRQLLVTVFSIFGVTLLSIGSAFSVFTTQENGEMQIIKVGTLNIDFGEDANNTLSLSGTYPMSDKDGLESKAYTFTIINTGTLPADYTIKVVEDTEMITTENCGNNLLEDQYVRYNISDDTVDNFSNLATKDNVIATGTLKKNESKTYNLKVWVSNTSPNTVLNKHFHKKIEIEGTTNEETEATNSVSNENTEVLN